MRWLCALALVLAGASALGTASAQQPQNWSSNDLVAAERCLNFMLMRKTYTGIVIRGDTFDCRGISEPVAGSAGRWRFVVDLGRQRTGFDDGVKITIFVAQDGANANPTFQVEDGGLYPSGGGFDVAPRVYPPHWYTLFGAALVREVAFAYPTRGWRKTAEALADMMSVSLARSIRNPDRTPAYFFDRPGGDISSYRMRDGTRPGSTAVDARFPTSYLTACEASCRATQGCHAWTVRRGDPPMCLLKGEGTRARMSADEVSGTVQPTLRLQPGAEPSGSPSVAPPVARRDVVPRRPRAPR
jgi:hypothetical protein